MLVRSDSLKSPIDETDAVFSDLLADLQGNILKGHGRHFTVNRFLSIDPAHKATARQAIGHLAASGAITSAAKQIADTEAFKAGGDPSIPVAFFFLTHAGYGKLGVDPTIVPDEPAFAQGMKPRSAALGDPAPAGWDHTFAGTIDALLLVGRDTKHGAKTYANQLSAGLAAAGIHVIGEEIGIARFEDGRGIEHFGYVDGRSQPLLLKSDVEREIQDLGGTNLWNAAFGPIDTVLVHDKGGKDEDSFGSFFVFRKLEQHVNAFKAHEQALATALGLTGEDRERAGAMVIGRFEDGTPVVLSKTAQDAVDAPNNFNYDQDVDAERCPFHAHIRKTNPRGDVRRQFGLPDDTGDRKPIMARRGITYGNRHKAELPFPEGGVGLLFMAYQRSLVDQFEFTQKSWANNKDFVRPATGIDPVIGQGTAKTHAYHASRDGSGPAVNFDFASFVEMKGGEYFFAPCLSFLKALAPGA